MDPGPTKSWRVYKRLSLVNKWVSSCYELVIAKMRYIISLNPREANWPKWYLNNTKITRCSPAWAVHASAWNGNGGGALTETWHPLRGIITVKSSWERHARILSYGKINLRSKVFRRMKSTVGKLLHRVNLAHSLPIGRQPQVNWTD